jgi:hypothetical protein
MGKNGKRKIRYISIDGYLKALGKQITFSSPELSNDGVFIRLFNGANFSAQEKNYFFSLSLLKLRANLFGFVLFFTLVPNVNISLIVVAKTCIFPCLALTPTFSHF